MRPAVAVLAKRHFVVLPRLVIVADLREFLAVPDGLDAPVLEDVPHAGRLEPIQAAHRHRAVVVDRQRGIDGRTGDPFRGRDHIREAVAEEHEAGAHDIHHADPAGHEGVDLVSIAVLNRERHPDPRVILVAPDLHEAKHRPLDLLQLVDAPDHLQGFLGDGIDAEQDRVHLDVHEVLGEIVGEREPVRVHRHRHAPGLHLEELLSKVGRQ